jgi:hypothetical protein
MTTPAGAQRTRRMQAIHSALVRALASDQDAAIDLLPEHQLLVSKHIVDAPAAQAGKAPQRVPGEDGFTIYVRLGSGDGGGRPQQRPSQPSQGAISDAATTQLTLDRTALDQSWQLRDRTGALIVLTVRCGSARVFGEVDRVLAALGRLFAAPQDGTPPSGA